MRMSRKFRGCKHGTEVPHGWKPMGQNNGIRMWMKSRVIGGSTYHASITLDGESGGIWNVVFLKDENSLGVDGSIRKLFDFRMHPLDRAFDLCEMEFELLDV